MMQAPFYLKHLNFLNVQNRNQILKIHEKTKNEKKKTDL